jgi:mRNA-degrading endonuclease YafQ of YafQ-DinJ toxin-antitoxin module
MKIIQSGIFGRKVKKLTKAQKLQLDEAILKILEHPATGEQKKGDLQSVFVYKFQIGNSTYLMAYRYTEDCLELIMLGSHESYYRDLKNYLNG